MRWGSLTLAPGGGEPPGRSPGRLSAAAPSGPAAYMLPVVMGPHTVGKAAQPSFSIKGRSKLGSFSDDVHKARGPSGRSSPPSASAPQPRALPRALSSPAKCRVMSAC